MRKSFYVLLAVTFLFVTMLSFGVGSLPAEETGPVKLVAKADKVHLAVDKNSNPYVRIVFTQNMTVSGHSIDVDKLLLCFSGTYKAAKRIRPGQEFTVIAVPSHYKGRINYQALKFIQ